MWGQRMRDDHWRFSQPGERFSNNRGIIRELVQVEGDTDLLGGHRPVEYWVVHWKRVGNKGPESGSCKWASWLRWIKEWVPHEAKVRARSS